MAAAQKGLDLKRMNEKMTSEGLKDSRQPDRTGLGLRDCWEVCSQPDREEMTEIGE